jgi:N-acetylneuraminic acid mutarotase
MMTAVQCLSRNNSITFRTSKCVAAKFQRTFIIALLLSLIALAAQAQSTGNQWTWMGGGDTVPAGYGGNPGIYGTPGTPAPTNIPGGRGRQASWTDSSGNFWLFGGYGADQNGTVGSLNDLWTFSPSLNEWTWMNGGNTLSAGACNPSVYGSLYTPASTNTPGGRVQPITWTDNNGHLWLLGGDGCDLSGLYGLLNDLWEYLPATNEWVWMSGSQSLNLAGAYATHGSFSSSNMPGARSAAATWTDSNNNLWVFGGLGYDINGTEGELNDLWEFNSTSHQWAWMGGNSTVNQPGLYGAYGASSTSYIPGGRYAPISWTDSTGHLWLFGGNGYDINANSGYLNDLWEFNPTTLAWTFITGNNIVNQAGVYGSPGTPAPTNIPGARYFSASWADKNGNLWLFGSAGYDANDTIQDLNDLWEYTPSINEWTWMAGSKIGTHNGIYGTLGSPGSTNTPGGRGGDGNWVDSAGNLWLEGGGGYDSVGGFGQLNDFWVFQPAIATTNTLTSSLNPSTFGASVTFTATVAPTTGTTSPTGSVQFSINGSPVGSAVTLVSGVATYTTSSLAVGTYSVTSVYTPTGVYTASSSNTVTQQVDAIGTTNALTSSLNPSTFGVSVTFTATISPTTGSSTPTGTVQFSVNGSPVGSAVTLVSGIATYASSTLPLGNNSVIAVYTPTGSYAASTSNTLDQVVDLGGANTVGQWTWMGGSDTINGVGVYGILGSPAPANIPGARGGHPVSWTDNTGNFWLLGGCTNSNCENNDLWMYSPTTNEWTWMNGSSTGNAAGVFGSLYTPSTTYTPGGRAFSIGTTDNNGHLWLFGGGGADKNNTVGYLNDLWEYNPSTNEWAWMSGSSTVPSYNSGQPGIYGTPGTPAPANTPGGREGPDMWTDSSNNLWLFGGLGYDVNGTYGVLNDLWFFNTTTHEWAWMGGSETVNHPGVYGPLGSFSATYIPGTRAGAASWTDSSGNYWLWGGQGYDVNGNNGFLNDLWEFKPSTNAWAWMGGSQTYNNLGVYGSLGASSTSYIPSSRFYPSTWVDNSGNLWLFGSLGYDAVGTLGWMNDLWMYNPTNSEWTWMSGSSTVPGNDEGQPGIYGTPNTPAATNTPGGRGGENYWIDKAGNFWMFDGGGADINGAFGNENDLWVYQPAGAISTTTSLVSSLNPSMYGANVTFTATVAPTTGTSTPTGTIQFSINGSPVGSAVTLSGGQATYSTSTLAVGSNNVVAVYSPTSNYTGSTSNTLVQVVNDASTTTVLASSQNPSTYGVSVTFTATVAPTVGSTTPTGTVQFTANGTTITGCSAQPMSSGVATCAINSLPVGTDPIVAIYSATGSYTGSTSNTVNQQVNPIGTTTLLASSQNPSTFGVSVTFTATVSPTTGSSTPTGTVQFSVNGSPVGSAVTLSAGIATYSTSTLAVGTDTISAVYTPTTNYTTSTSNTVSQQINPIGTTTLLASSQNPSTFGVSVTFTATVSPTTGSSTPTGTVQFSANGSTIAGCSAQPMSSGIATCATNSLAVGTDTISAVYTPTTNYSGSTSNTVSQRVLTKAATPLITPGSLTFYVPVTVTITDTTPGAVIYYTTDGSTPITSPTTLTYAGPFSVINTETVSAIATASGYANSSLAAAVYTQGNFFWAPTTTTFIYGTSLGSVPGLLNAISHLPGNLNYFIHGNPVNASTVLNVGQYQLDAIFTTTGGAYQDKISYKITVTPVTLTVTPNPVTVTYGSAVPLYTYSITGFVNSDNASVVTGSPTFTSNATSRATTTGAVVFTSNIGLYTINSTWGSIKAANYTFTFQSAQLTINPCTCSLTVIPYDDVITQGSPIPSSFAYKVTGFLNWDNAANQLSGTAATSTNAVNGSPHGYYTIYSAPGTLQQIYSNYAGIIYHNATLTIH